MTPKTIKAVSRTVYQSKLPDDVARCDGVSSVEEGVIHWREGCEDCLRRTANRPKHVVIIAPEPTIVFECVYRLEPCSK